MTKTAILEQAYRSKEFDQVIKNICKSKPHYFDDLKQEVFIMLFDKKDDLIIDLHNENKLIAYFNRIVQLQVISNNSKFHYIYRKNNNDLTDDMSMYETIEDDEPIKQDFDIDQYVIQNKLLTWYEYEMFNLYYRINPSFLQEDISVKMSYQKMVELVGLKKKAITNIMGRIKTKIFTSIINDPELSNEIPFENLEYMQDFIDKNQKKKQK